MQHPYQQFQQQPPYLQQPYQQPPHLPYMQPYPQQYPGQYPQPIPGYPPYVPGNPVPYNPMYIQNPNPQHMQPYGDQRPANHMQQYPNNQQPPPQQQQQSNNQQQQQPHGKPVDSYKSKLQKYYEFLPTHAVNELKHTDEATYSVSPFGMAFNIAQITDYIMTQLFKLEQYNMLDMTCCVGGDSFAQAFFAKQVESYELNVENYNCFQQNKLVFSKYGFSNQANKISCFNDDSTKYITNQQIITGKAFATVIDAPWGGPDFIKQQNIKLKLGEKSIEQITNELLAQQDCKLVILKLPKNYDKNHLQNELSKYNLVDYQIRNVLFYFISNQQLTKQLLQQFVSTLPFLEDKDLLKEDQFENFCAKSKLKLQYELKCTINLRNNLRRIVNEVQQRNVVFIKVNCKLKIDSQVKSVLNIAIGLAVLLHVPANVYFIDEDQRRDANDMLRQLYDYVQYVAGNRPSVVVPDFRTNNPVLSIGDNHDAHAFHCLVLSGQACNMNFLRGEHAIDLVEEVVRNMSGFVSYSLLK